MRLEEFLQGEVDAYLSRVYVGSETLTRSLKNLTQDIDNGAARICGDFVLTMDDHIRQMEIVLEQMKKANVFMRAKNRSER